MAEQRINLNNFKSSGVYTIEIDQSENLTLPLTTGRLVVGSSRVGPFNTVVLINDIRTLRAVYGEIDPKLEKEGSYFHRTIEVSLKEGPVFALNVIGLDTDTDVSANLDQAYFKTFNSESAANNNPDTVANTYPMVEFFNRKRLWFADSYQLNRSKNLALGDDFVANPGGFGQTTLQSNKILSFANLGSANSTIWVRKSDVRGFDITAKEWFSTIGGGNSIEYPSFVHPDDFISDYFVEVIIVNGDWTNYLKLAKDPIYKTFFDDSGLKISRAAEFFALREIKVISRTIGCLIPDFKDQSGLTVSIDRLINRLFPTTGVLCALDTRKLDLIDLETNDPFTDSDVTTHRVDIAGHGFDDLAYYIDNGTYDTDGNTVALSKLVDTLSYSKPADGELIYIFDANYAEVNLAANIAIGEIYTITAANDYIVATKGSTLYEAYTKGFIKTGDTITDGSNSYYVKVLDTLATGSPSIPYIKIETYSDIALLNQENATDLVYTDGADDFVKFILQDGDDFKYIFDLDTDFFSYSITQPNTITLGVFAANKSLVDEYIKVNQYIKAKSTDGRVRLLKIISVSSATQLTSPATYTYTVKTMAPSVDNVVGIDYDADPALGYAAALKVYKGVYNFAPTLKGQYAPGYKIREALLPKADSDGQRQREILSYLFESTSIPQALATGELVDFRYVVDSYQGEIYSSSKYYLAKLAAMHGQAMALLNAPSVQQFEQSVDPSFIDTTTKLVSAEYIAQGGDLSLNPSFTFQFAEEDVNGVPLSSYATYYFPNLIIRSGNKNLSVPPAAYVSNLYVKKFKNGTPFLIVAGGKRGAINDSEVVGIEYDLTDEDRNFLEPAGHNLIVKRRGFGIILFSNNTAYQRINSALNNAHVRDNLSTIERDIEKILFNFLFDFNDEITRLRVKTLVQNYLDAVVSARGLSSYEVIFDSSNNTNEVISANTAIIDIRVDFPRGIHKFINRITITRVGGQLSSESTGFIPSF
jgi:hypothetical protein